MLQALNGLSQLAWMAVIASGVSKSTVKKRCPHAATNSQLSSRLSVTRGSVCYADVYASRPR